ncbi:MAG: hypothetical protein V2I27_12875 [Erythrobacter sp.]|jgi:hypothetical protein|nr:hypothetical protein [Erythrobacter sp.]
MSKPTLLALLALVSSVQDDEALNCPKPLGELTIDRDTLFRAMPSHIDRLLPYPLTVDFACRVDESGKFADCRFATREVLSEAQSTALQRMMPRMMLAISTDVPLQPCVASTITFERPATSEPTPHEPAG